MNLDSLGRTLGALFAKHEESLPDPVRNVIGDAIDLLGQVDDGTEQFFAGFHDAYRSNEPGADGILGYHCHSCKMTDAPVEELTPQEMADYIVDYSSNAAKVELIEQVGDDEHELTRWEDVVKSWFTETRAEQNPDVWGKPDGYTTHEAK